MGLNTIFSYLYWHQIEPHQGQFNFTCNNDIAAWFQEIQNAGMKAVLRPGTYICGERDWSGLPGWLTQISGMKIRSNNSPFLTASGNYLAKVGAQLHGALNSNGGPILMVQIENEYGYVGNDHTYTNALSNLIKTNFPTRSSTPMMVANRELSKVVRYLVLCLSLMAQTPKMGSPYVTK